MTMLYVGNLPFTANEDNVREIFAAHGPVETVSLVVDRSSRKPRGFGFIEMAGDAAGRAMQALDGQDFGGRPMKVRQAEERALAGNASPDRRGA
jgi:RNA recognition motif-containing protein